MKYLIKGERCSGTNYIDKLIFLNLNIEKHHTPEWKHGYFCFGVTDTVDKPKLDYLTIIIFRNVLDWSRSFYLEPHHMFGAKSGVWQKQITFSQFIRNKVIAVDDKDNARNLDRHPYSLDLPKNIFELRKWKIENWLNYQKTQRPVYYLKYEDLAENPEAIIREINDKWFGVDFTFQNWPYRKQTNMIYTAKKYFNIRDTDMKHIIDSVDWDLEKKIGYDPVHI